MSTVNGKLITPLLDETERIDGVEKKVKTVVVSVRELIDYANQATVRLEKTSTKVSNLEQQAIALDNRLKTVESKQKESVTKVLSWLNFLVLMVILGSFFHWQQIQPELKNNLKTLVESLNTVEDK